MANEATSTRWAPTYTARLVISAYWAMAWPTQWGADTHIPHWGNGHPLLACAGLSTHLALGFHLRVPLAGGVAG